MPAQKTFGTKLKRGEEYVAKLLNISPPEMSREDIDVTNHDSPDEFREFIPGLKDGGEVPVEGHLIPTDSTQTSLLAAIDINEPEPWTIEFPTIPKLYVRFTGYVKSFKVGDAPIDGSLTFTATIRVTGKPVIEVDASTGLSALAINDSLAAPVDLAPVFANSVREYFASVANTVTYVNVTPTAADHTITVNGVEVASGEASGNINLAAGAMTTITVKAQQEGKAEVTYVIKVYRAGE